MAAKYEEEFRVPGTKRPKSHSQIQNEFFLTNRGRKRFEYQYQQRGFEPPRDSIVLFRFDGLILAQARFLERVAYPQPIGIYRGKLVFQGSSIEVFTPPLTLEDMRSVWHKVTYGQWKNDLDASKYWRFRERFVDSPHTPVSAALNNLDGPLPKRRSVEYLRVVRDSKRTSNVKRLHDYRCQIIDCKCPPQFPNGESYVEGHHIKPLGKHKGRDVEENILCLCAYHHAACDYGAMTLSIRRLRKVDGHRVATEFIRYHNEKIHKHKAFPI